MTRVWFDIETLPAIEKPGLEDIPYPANYKNEDVILKYRIEKQDEVHRKTALNSMKGRIACISYIVTQDWIIDSTPTIKTVTVFNQSEQAALKQFFSEIKKRVGKNFCWCGWNIAEFDVPFLFHKTCRLCPEYLHMLPQNRYSDNIFDIRQIWTFGNRYQSGTLQEVAEYLGMTTLPINGRDVYDLYQTGRTYEITQHCEDDVLTAYKIGEIIKEV